MIQHGAVQGVCKTIKKHEINDSMVKAGIDTLGNIIKNKEMAAKVAEKGAVEALLRVLRV